MENFQSCDCSVAPGFSLLLLPSFATSFDLGKEVEFTNSTNSDWRRLFLASRRGSIFSIFRREKSSLLPLLWLNTEMFLHGLMLPVPIPPWWSSTACLYGPMPSRLSRNRGKCILNWSVELFRLKSARRLVPTPSWKLPPYGYNPIASTV